MNTMKNADTMPKREIRNIQQGCLNNVSGRAIYPDLVEIARDGDIEQLRAYAKAEAKVACDAYIKYWRGTIPQYAIKYINNRVVDYVSLAIQHEAIQAATGWKWKR